MILKKVQYTNFRNIESAEMTFCPGVNLLYGDNAQGKTNALEGIYLFAAGRSHRTAHERDYIRFGEEFAKVSIDCENSLRPFSLEIRYLRNGRKFCRKNGLPIRKMSELIGSFRAVLFYPKHLNIVSEGPKERRAYIDGALAQTDPEYLSELQKFSAALAQRNKLIAEYPFHPENFEQTGDLWAQHLAASGEILSQKRAAYVEEVEKEMQAIFADMTGGGEKPELRYRTAMSKEEYMRLYEENKKREIKAGSTLYGVHKDEVEIFLNGKPARSFCSQGQQRSLAIAMKLAEGEISYKKTGEHPVYLLDDVFSELDKKRKQFILSGLSGRQVLITCCDARDAGNIPEGQVITVEAGKYQKIR